MRGPRLKKKSGSSSRCALAAFKTAGQAPELPHRSDASHQMDPNAQPLPQPGFAQPYTVHVAGAYDPNAQPQANREPPVTFATLTDAGKWDKLDLRNVPGGAAAEIANLHEIHGKGMITDDQFSFGLWVACGVGAQDALQIMKMRMDRTPTRVKTKERWELFVVATLSLWADGLTELLRAIVKLIDTTANSLGGLSDHILDNWTHAKLVRAPDAAAPAAGA